MTYRNKTLGRRGDVIFLREYDHITERLAALNLDAGSITSRISKNMVTELYTFVMTTHHDAYNEWRL